MIKVIEVSPKDYKIYYKPIQDVVSSLDKTDQKFLGLTKDDNGLYLQPKQYKWLGKRWVALDGDKVVGFFDILIDGKIRCGNISFAVHSDYHNQGIGTSLVNKANTWINTHITEYDNIMWGVHEDNKASIKLAERCGFKHIKSRDEKRKNGLYLGYIKSKSLLELARIIDNIKIR